MHSFLKRYELIASASRASKLLSLQCNSVLSERDGKTITIFYITIEKGKIVVKLTAE